MLIRLQKYDVRMIYTPGKFMFTADALSRAVNKMESPDEQRSAEIKAYVDMIVTSLPVSAKRTEQIRKATELDETMRELKKTILTGWPKQ